MAGETQQFFEAEVNDLLHAFIKNYQTFTKKANKAAGKRMRVNSIELRKKLAKLRTINQAECKAMPKNPILSERAKKVFRPKS